MKKRLLISILVLIPVAVFFNAGLLELRLEEPRRALVALEMMLRNSYLVPQINGQLYFTKPPLFNWAILLSYHIFGGPSELAARMPGLLSYFATAILLYWFAKQFFSREKALLSALFFLTASDLFLFGTVISAEIDLFFTLVITLQLVSVFYFFNRGQWLLMFLTSYFFTALGVLTKGVPALLFEGITLLVVCIYYRRFKLLFSWYHIAGILCFGIVAGTYFYAYQRATGEVYTYFAKLFYDATEKSVLEHSVLTSFLNFLLSPLHLLRFFAPWFLFVLLLHKKQGRATGTFSEPFIAAIAISVLVNLLPMLFTSETKANYIYPLYPLIALLLAHIYLENKDDRPVLIKWLDGFFFVMMLIVLLAIAAGPFVGIVKNSVPFIWLKTCLLFLGGAIIARLHKKYPPLRIYILILFVVLLRLMESVYYLPVYKATSKQQQFAQFIKNITKQVNGKDIFLGGKPSIQQAFVGLGPLRLDTITISSPPFIQFQAPYYYSSINGKVMKYDAEFTKGRYYLLFSSELPDSVHLLLLNKYQPAKTRKEIFYLVTPKP